MASTSIAAARESFIVVRVVVRVDHYDWNAGKFMLGSFW